MGYIIYQWPLMQFPCFQMYPMVWFGAIKGGWYFPGCFTARAMMGSDKLKHLLSTKYDDKIQLIHMCVCQQYCEYIFAIMVPNIK